MAKIHYGTWNEMLNTRDELHTDYIREYDGGKRWELVRYSRWSEDTWLGCCGQSAATLDELIERLTEQGYDVNGMDICTYGD